MPLKIEVKGRVMLSYSLLNAATPPALPTPISSPFLQLGESDANDLPEWEEVVHERPIYTSGSGPNLPAKIISLGRSGILRANLINFDQTLLDAIQTCTGASAVGQLGSLGADVVLFSFAISGSISGSRIYTFPTCRFIDRISDIGWGMQENKKRLMLQAIPHPNALGSATTPLYTISNVA